jgi:hypothetical protein
MTKLEMGDFANYHICEDIAHNQQRRMYVVYKLETGDVYFLIDKNDGSELRFASLSEAIINWNLCEDEEVDVR